MSEEIKEKQKLLESNYLKLLLDENLYLARRVDKLEILCVWAVVMSLFNLLSTIAEYLLNLFGYLK